MICKGNMHLKGEKVETQQNRKVKVETPQNRKVKCMHSKLLKYYSQLVSKAKQIHPLCPR